MLTKYFPADFFLMKGSSRFFSGMIAEKTREQPGRTFSHAMVCIGEGSNPEVIEAVIPRVRRVKLAEALSTAEYAICMRPLGLTRIQQQQIIQEAMRHEGELYGFDGYFTKFPGALFSSDAFERLQLIPRFPDCSELAGLCLEAAGRTFGDAPHGLSPNELNDYAQRHPDEWERFAVHL